MRTEVHAKVIRAKLISYQHSTTVPHVITIEKFAACAATLLLCQTCSWKTGKYPKIAGVKSRMYTYW